MTVLQSNDKYYEFDPSTFSVREDAWGKYYQGRCKTASATKDVLIYKFLHKASLSRLFVETFKRMPLHEIKDKQLSRIVKKATEKNPTKRYLSAREFIVALSNIENVYIPWYRKIFRYFHKKNCLLHILLSTLFAFFFCQNSDAQNTMRINYKDGNVYEVPIERIDSITFVEKNEESHEISLFGEWFWGSKEKGYYEVMTFNEDRTYIGYDYYLEYGFDTWTYGTYIDNGIMLNLWSKSYGYCRAYRWFVAGLTENALKVMTQIGSFVYFRIMPDVITLKIGDAVECSDGDSIVFADEVIVHEEENKLYGVAKGTTYIQKSIATSGLIYAYKVVVE